MPINLANMTNMGGSSLELHWNIFLASIWPQTVMWSKSKKKLATICHVVQIFKDLATICLVVEIYKDLATICLVVEILKKKLATICHVVEIYKERKRNIFELIALVSTDCLDQYIDGALLPSWIRHYICQIYYISRFSKYQIYNLVSKLFHYKGWLPSAKLNHFSC